MRAGIWTAVWAIGAIAGVLSEAHAWPAATSGGMSIAEAREHADTGDYFSIGGVVVSSSQNRVFTIRDQTGEMLVVIPQYITRETGIPQAHERVVVRGKYDNKKLDASVKGMRVTHLSRLGRVDGHKGKPSPAAHAVTVTGSGAASPAGAFLNESSATTYQPTASADLKERLRAKRLEFGTAKADAEAVASLYADALYAAGDGPVDSEIQGRLQRAEARVAAILASLPPLIDEARAAGVSQDLLELYKQSAGMSR